MRTALSRESLLEFLKQHHDELRSRFGVKRIGLFGSFVRDESEENSDVDVLVELEKQTFDGHMDLKFYLEDFLGAGVDLVIADSLKPRLQPIIMREVVYAT